MGGYMPPECPRTKPAAPQPRRGGFKASGVLGDPRAKTSFPGEVRGMNRQSVNFPVYLPLYREHLLISAKIGG
jgi:hypothetical protein